jgi:hypothetical protein
VLPFSAVAMFGEDTVIASTGTAIVDAAQWRKAGVTAQRLSALRKKADPHDCRSTCWVLSVTST